MYYTLNSKLLPCFLLKSYFLRLNSSKTSAQLLFLQTLWCAMKKKAKIERFLRCFSPHKWHFISAKNSYKNGLVSVFKNKIVHSMLLLFLFFIVLLNKTSIKEAILLLTRFSVWQHKAFFWWFISNSLLFFSAFILHIIIKN